LLFFVHPYVFGLPGRIGETWFAASLRTGMTRNDVVRLATRLGGRGMNGSSIAPNWVASVTHGAPGALDVLFTDTETLCIGSGKWYTLDFGSDWKLTSWSVQPWGSAC
jgi:hypothetical protein